MMAPRQVAVKQAGALPWPVIRQKVTMVSGNVATASGKSGFTVLHFHCAVPAHTRADENKEYLSN